MVSIVFESRKQFIAALVVTSMAILREALRWRLEVFKPRCLFGVIIDARAWNGGLRGVVWTYPLIYLGVTFDLAAAIETCVRRPVFVVHLTHIRWR